MPYRIEFLKGAKVLERTEVDFDTAAAARDHAVSLMATHLQHATAFLIRSAGGAVLARWPDA